MAHILKSLWLISFLLIPFNLSAGPIKDIDVLREIYDGLKQAIGDRNITWPLIKIEEDEKKVAAFTQDNTIIVYQKTIETCRSFGPQFKDALAFIIGHELTHFYQDHQWKTPGFTPDFLVTSQVFMADQENEKQADIYGAFIAHQAGYQSIRLVPDILEKIYRSNGLNTASSSRYPSLAQRQKLSGESCQMAQRLIQAYEVANYLAALGQFESAFQLYYHVQTYIRFRELYNNLGVALLKHYYQFSEDQPGYFPLEMEVDHPILRESAPPVTSTLDLAVEYLSRATHLDPGQYEAFLHLLIAYLWKKDDQQVESLIGKLNTYLTDPRQIQKLQIISGLYSRAKGNSASARSFFEKAREIAADPALTEMAMLNQQQLDLPERVRREIIPAPQFVQDIMDDQSFLNRIPAFDDTIRINDEYLLLVKFFPNSSLYHLQSKREKPTLKLQIADNRLPISREGIRIGSDQQQLFTTYEGTAGIKTGYTRGFYQIYPARGLIFRCNKAGKIDSWALFMF